MTPNVDPIKVSSWSFLLPRLGSNTGLWGKKSVPNQGSSYPAAPSVWCPCCVTLDKSLPLSGLFAPLPKPNSKELGMAGGREARVCAP